MRRFVLVWIVLVACNSTEELEKKVDDLSKELAVAQRENDRRIDQLAKEVASAKYLERKLDDVLKDAQRTRDLVSRPTTPARIRRPEPDKAKTYAVPVGNAPALGPPDAKVTMIVAGEYSCQWCEKARPTLEGLRTKYGRNLRMVFKQMVVHPATATASALAVCAANRQGRYKEMDAMLWDKGFNLRRQDRDARCWESVTGCMIVNELAQTLGLSLTKFKADMKACHVDLTDGMRDLTQFGISSTPTFFINGRFVSGALPSYQFESLIEEELAKAEARIAGGSPRATYYKDWVMDKGLRELEQTTVTGTPGTTLDP